MDNTRQHEANLVVCEARVGLLHYTESIFYMQLLS